MKSLLLTVYGVAVLGSVCSAGVLLQAGFEGPDYSPGNLNGQQGWGGDAQPGEAIVTGARASAGTQSLLITGDGYTTGYSELGAHHLFAYDPLGMNETVITLQADTYLASATPGEGFSFWVWDYYGYQLAGHILLGAVSNVAVLDASSNPVDTGVACVTDAWVPLRIVSDYTAGTFDVFYNGVLAVNDMGFETVGANAVNDLWIGVENKTVGGAMYVDNILVLATGLTAVPEPASLLLLGLGTAGLMLRRRHHR